MSDDRQEEIEGMLDGDVVPEATSPGPKVPVPETHHSLTEDGHVRSVRVGNDFFDEQVAGALAKACQLYRYQGEPGSVETTPRERTRFRRATKEHVRELVDQHITLIKTAVVRDKKTGLRITETPVPTSADLATLVLDRLRRDARVPELRYLVEHPAYAPGWAPVEPGYNAGGYFYAEPLDLKGLGKFTGRGKQRVEPEQIRRHFDDLLIDFPFARPTDRENFVALMLTFLVRPALDHHTPFFLVQASRERTGKSKLLSEVLGPTIFGQPLIASVLKANDEEVEKTITSVLVSGRSYVFYDNLERELGGERHCALLTSRYLADRILGSTNHTVMENILVCMGTSNNATASKDMHVRAISRNGGQVMGHRPLALDAIEPGLLLDRSPDDPG